MPPASNYTMTDANYRELTQRHPNPKALKDSLENLPSKEQVILFLKFGQIKSD